MRAGGLLRLGAPLRASRLVSAHAALFSVTTHQNLAYGGSGVASMRPNGPGSGIHRRGFQSTAPLASDRYEKPWNTGAVIVPQQMAYVVERFGKFQSVLVPGLNIIIPFIDRVAYVHSLKEEALSIPNQMAITSDNVTLMIDGVLYVRVVDPFKASYGVTDALFAIMQLAQTTMRSELGKLSLDQTFKDREVLNSAIVLAIQPAALDWGVEALRYEIRDIQVPQKIKDAMDQQAEAERRKRAHVLDSEAEQLSDINIAEGRKRAQVLASEADYQERVNRARGDAEAVVLLADATAASIKKVAEALKVEGGRDAVTLRVAEQYVSAFEKLAKETNTVLLPSTPGDPAAMVGAAMGIFEGMRGGAAGGSGGVRGVKGGLPPSKLADLKREVEAQLAAGAPESEVVSGGGGSDKSDGADSEERRAHA